MEGIMAAAATARVESKLEKSPSKAGMLVFGVILLSGILYAGINLLSDLSGVRTASTFAYLLLAAVAPYPTPLLPVTLTVAGFPAQILYAGSAPGAVGLLQVNARVPAGFIPTGPVAAELTVGSAVAPRLTIWLK